LKRFDVPMRWKIRAVIAALLLTLAVSEKRIEPLGDSFQIALPVIALGCSVTNGKAADFLIRYVVQWGAVHTSKALLGDSAINRRPNGKIHGTPSGHMATATFGASNLVHECIAGQPLVQGVVILTAGFVGASRIEAAQHFLWQVMLGVLVGWFADRSFRKRSPWGWLKRLLGKN